MEASTLGISSSRELYMVATRQTEPALVTEPVSVESAPRSEIESPLSPRIEYGAGFMNVNRLARYLESMRTDCVIWPGYSATRHDLGSGLFQYHSSRTTGGGIYRITQETIDAMEARTWFQHPYVSKRLTTHLIDEWLLDNDPPLVTVGLLQDLEQRALPVYTRAERLLRCLSRETSTVGEYVHLKKVTEEDVTTMGRFESTLDALAWSESEKWGEVEFLLGYLKSNGWVQLDRDDREAVNCIVTVDGHSKIAESETGKDFAQCFVAMWFDPSMAEAYDKGIKLAIKDAGYKPLRIDRPGAVEEPYYRIAGRGARTGRVLAAIPRQTRLQLIRRQIARSRR